MSNFNSVNPVANEYKEKKEALKEKLQQRTEERIASQEKRRAEKSRDYNISEEATYFTELFNQNKAEIENKLDDESITSKTELKEHFDSITVDIQNLSKLLADSVMFLPSYDIRITQESIKLLQEKVKQKEERLAPKKKFTFKTQRNLGEPKAMTIKPDKIKEDESGIPLYDCGFQNLKNEKLKMTSEEINFKDVGLHKLTNCEIRLEGMPSTLHMSQLAHCKIYTGPVKSSIFVEECKDCLFVFACQQLRTHKTTDTDIYLYVTSNPIVEDCFNIRFAPYNWCYASLDEHFTLAEFDSKENMWYNVKDFNWLVAGVQSPNWSILPEEERLYCNRD